MTLDRLLTGYDYYLPQDLVAQVPATPRDSSRLLVVDSRESRHFTTFDSLPSWLRPGDLLVLNDTRVIRARLYGRKVTGAPVEALLLREKTARSWLSLVKPGKRFKVGTELVFSPRSGATEDEGALWKARVVERDPATGGRTLEFHLPDGRSFLEMLEVYGHIPLPPYITNSTAGEERYQTVYADKAGSVAAPTAGLHFTPELFQKLELRGIATARITLHVGVGTFRPVETENITDHTMHSEYFEIPDATVRKITETKAAGGRVIAVGTTVVRALEGASDAGGGRLKPFRGETELFIYPGYRWRTIDGMITNFHLPRSSLMMLVSAAIGRETLLHLYREAIERRFRFYSFGDAMLILPEARI